MKKLSNDAQHFAWNKTSIYIDNVIESDFQIFKTCKH